MQSPVWRTLALAVGPLVILGCGGKGGTYPVTGVVTLKGQALPNAVVSFYPAQGRPAAGTTNTQGEFSLSTFTSQDGAVAGVHRVAIAEPARQMPPGDYSVPTPTPPRFPARYTDPAESGLTAEVKPGSANHFTFDLKE